MTKDTAPIRGLATVALLKANFDKGKDHLGMFLPFIVDSVANLPRDDFSVHELKECLYDRHGLSVPQGTLRVLITRATRKGFIRREEGRYFRLTKVRKVPDLKPQQDSVVREHEELAEAFRNYAASWKLVLKTHTEALSLLISFLAENEMAVLLHDDSTGIETITPHRTQRIVARFFRKTLGENSRLTRILDQLIQGYVLQNALLLKDISKASRPFQNLEVFLDSNCVLRALGLEGGPNKIATREALSILKTMHARLTVFHSTIDEIRRILSLYEHRIGTTTGRKSLRPGALAQHFFRNHYSPADVRQASALIEHNLRQLGIGLKQFPKRQKEFTLTERSLTLKLKRPNESETEPRIVHDVDCIAAILTFRRGLEPRSYDNAGAVFLTTNNRLVATVSEWMTEEGVEGLPPIVHQIRLTNFAWLKKPAAAIKLKTNELIALCTAALKPSREIWNRFTKHLQQLQEQDEITSDEAVAILASSYLNKYLSDAEDEDETDPGSIIEIIDRVKGKYRADAEARILEAKRQAHAEGKKYRADAETRVLEAKRQAHSEGEKSRQLELQLQGFVGRIATMVSLLTISVVGVAILVGLALCLPGLFDLWLGPSWTGWVMIAVFGVFTALSLFRGTALKNVYLKLQSTIAQRLETYIHLR